MRKQPSPALRGACQPVRGVVRGGWGAGSLDTLPPWLGEGSRGVGGGTPDRPTDLSPTHLEDLPIRAVAQAAEPVETLLEEGLRSAWVIPRALQGLRGLVPERHPPGVGLMPAWGPRREEAADGDAALGRGPGREAPAEPPGPLEGEARFCMAEVGWDWDRGATQGCKSRVLDPWVGKIPWRRAWQPTPVFLPGDCHGQRSLAGYSSWSHKEADRTEAT